MIEHGDGADGSHMGNLMFQVSQLREQMMMVRTVTTVHQFPVPYLAQIAINGVVHTGFKNLFQGLSWRPTVVTFPLVIHKVLDLTKGLMYVCNRYR